MKNLLALLLFVPSLCLSQSDYCDTIFPYPSATLQFDFPSQAEIQGPTGFDLYEWNDNSTDSSYWATESGSLSVVAIDTLNPHQASFWMVNESPQTPYQGSWSNAAATNGELLRESPSNQWTFALWVNLDSADSHHSIIGKELWWGNGYRIWIYNDELKSAFNSAESGYVVRTAGTVPKEAFHHIAVTHDGASRKHYLDGVEVGSWAEPSSFEFGSHTVGIGWCASGFDCTFNGKMDELSVWHKALSPEEIGAFMSCPYEANQDSLVAFWDFEFDNGGYTADKTGNGHTLSIINNPGISFEERSNSCQPFCVSATYDVTITFEGCTDDYACNYSSEATINDGSCDYSCCPGPGCCGEGTLWDSTLGHCVTVSTLCAASCGEGTVWDPISEECIIAIPADLNLDGCVTVNDLLLLLAVHSTCPPYPEWPDEPTDTTWICGDPLTYWDYDYATVLIGDQCWFAENLRTQLYTNGDTIVGGLNSSEWSSTNEGAVAVYGQMGACYTNYNPDFDACNEWLSLEANGRWYNWHSVTDSRGLCPSGWSAPTDNEWADLLFTVSNDGFDGNEGEAIKSTSGWYEGGNGTDNLGFTGTPAGNCSRYGWWGDAGRVTYWWTSTPSGSTGWAWSLAHDTDVLARNNYHPRFGFSVRCIKD